MTDPLEEELENAKNLITQIWGVMFERRNLSLSDADALKKIEDILNKGMKIT